MPKTKWDWMAYTAIGIGQVAFVYEMIDIVNSEDSTKFTWPFVILGLVTTSLGLIYGFKNKLMPLIITGIIDEMDESFIAPLIKENFHVDRSILKENSS